MYYIHTVSETVGKSDYIPHEYSIAIVRNIYRSISVFLKSTYAVIAKDCGGRFIHVSICHCGVRVGGLVAVWLLGSFCQMCSVVCVLLLVG